MERSSKRPDCIASLRRIWPVRRTWLAVAGIGFPTTVVALFLPLWCTAIPAGILGLSLLLRPLRRPVWLLSCCVCLLFWGMSSIYRATVAEPLERLDGNTVTLSGWVEDTLSENGYLLRITASDRLPDGTRLILYCSDLYAPAVYDMVTAEVRLETPELTQASYRAQGLHLLAFPVSYTDGITITGTIDPPLRHWPKRINARLTHRLRQHLPGDEGALLAALCLGQKQALPETVTAAFRGSGVAHLLVVSGLHLSMLTGCVLWLFRRLGFSRRVASAVTLPFVAAFMLLVGLTAPVVRAGLMCFVWLGGRLFRRQADGMNSLGLAAGVLLLYNPYMAIHASFLLSFSATAGVLCLTPRLLAALQENTTGASPGKRWLLTLYNGVAGALAACAGALLFLLPLLCYYFGGFPLITPLTNLLTALPSSVALLSGWAGLLLSLVPGVGWLAKGVLLVAGLSARCAIGAATLCSRTPLFIEVNSPWQFFLVTGICLTLTLCILCRRPDIHRRLLAGLTGITVLALSLHGILSPRLTTVTIRPDGEQAVVLLESPAGDALLVTHSDRLADAAALLEETHTTRLAFLCIGGGESPDAGYLTQLLKTADTEAIYTVSSALWATGCPVELTLLPPGSSLSMGHLTLTPQADTLWQIHNGDTSLLLCGGEARLPTATTTDWAVFCGKLPDTSSAHIRQGVLLCPADTIPKTAPATPPADAFLLLPEEVMTLTAFPGGEWSLQP